MPYKLGVPDQYFAPSLLEVNESEIQGADANVFINHWLDILSL